MSEWLATNWEWVLVGFYTLEKVVKLSPSKKDDIMFDAIIKPIFSIGESLVETLRIERDKICSRRPEKCPKCSSSEIVGVEIIGSYNGILFWECNKCDSAILRFKEEATEKYLEKAKDLWTNPADWGYVPRSKFN
jgi:hypothetical protein